jgi:NADPH-dependent curcumin reductase CurA
MFRGFDEMRKEMEREFEESFKNLENAPKAFIALFEGKNTGKMLVRIWYD